MHDNAIVHALVTVDHDGHPSPPRGGSYLFLLLPPSCPFPPHPSYIPSHTVQLALSTCNTSILLGWSQPTLYGASLATFKHSNSSGLVPIHPLPYITVPLQTHQFFWGWPQLIPYRAFLHTLEVFPFHRRCASHVILFYTCWIHPS